MKSGTFIEATHWILAWIVFVVDSSGPPNWHPGLRIAPTCIVRRDECDGDDEGAGKLTR